MPENRAAELEKCITGMLSDDPVERIVAKMMLSDNPATALIDGIQAEGQKSFVFSDTLPSDMYGERKHFEAMGIVFGENVEGDKLFVRCQLPEGWKKQATNHSMWSNLLDEKGRIRAAIMYKAVSCDRDAGMSACCRLSARMDYSSDEYRLGQVFDGDQVLFVTEKHFFFEEELSWQASESVKRELTEWLEKNFPDYKDVAAYWDVEDMKALIH